MIVTSDLSRIALPCRESESRAGGTCAISVNKSNPYRLILQDFVYVKILYLVNKLIKIMKVTFERSK